MIWPGQFSKKPNDTFDWKKHKQKDEKEKHISLLK